MTATCCLMVDDATLEEEDAETANEMFNCDECEISAQMQALDAFNCRTWAIYRHLVTRLAADMHSGGVVLERLTADLDPDDFAELWRRLVILYDVICPPSQPNT